MDLKRINLKLLINALFLILIIFGIYLIIRTGDLEKLKQIRHQINYWGLGGVLGITVLNVILLIYRWYLLLKPVKADIAFTTVFHISISAIAIDFTGPGKLGLPTKALLLKNMQHVEISQSTPSLMSELILEYSVAFLLMVFAAGLGRYYQIVIDSFHRIWQSIHIPGVVLALIIVSGLFFLFKNKLKSSTFFKKLALALNATKRKRKFLRMGLVVTVINFLLTFLADMWLYHCLGYRISFLFIIFSGCFAHFMALLSPLPAGLGMREMSSAYLFKVFYQLGEVAVIAVLIRRILTYISLVVLFTGEKLITPLFEARRNRGKALTSVVDIHQT